MSDQASIADLQQRLAALEPDATPGQRARLLSQLATACARAGLPREGLDAVKDALRLTGAHGLLHEQAEALNAASMCHYFRGDHMMAIASGLDAYQGFSRSGALVLMGHALTTIAASCKEIGAVDLSVEALEGCLNIASRSGDAFLEARSRNTLGIVLGESERFDGAEQHLAIAMRCLESIGAVAYLPKVAVNLGAVFKKRAESAMGTGDEAGAERLLRRAVALLEKIPPMEGEASLFERADQTIVLAEYYFLLREFGAAREYANEALELGRKLKLSRVVIESCLYLGRIQLAGKELAGAESSLKQVLDLARAAELRDLQLLAHRYLADCYAAMGRSVDAEAQAATAADMSLANRAANQEAQREVRQLWEQYFSRHPLIGPAS